MAETDAAVAGSHHNAFSMVPVPAFKANAGEGLPPGRQQHSEFAALGMWERTLDSPHLRYVTLNCAVIFLGQCRRSTERTRQYAHRQVAEERLLSRCRGAAQAAWQRRTAAQRRSCGTGCCCCTRTALTPRASRRPWRCCGRMPGVHGTPWTPMRPVPCRRCRCGVAMSGALHKCCTFDGWCRLLGCPG